MRPLFLLSSSVESCYESLLLSLSSLLFANGISSSRRALERDGRKPPPPLLLLRPVDSLVCYVLMKRGVGELGRHLTPHEKVKRQIGRPPPSEERKKVGQICFPGWRRKRGGRGIFPFPSVCLSPLFCQSCMTADPEEEEEP